MELKEILKVDTEPIPEEFIEQLCGHGGYCEMPSNFMYHILSLTMRYFQLFDKKYQVGLEKALEDYQVLGLDVNPYDEKFECWYEDSRILMDIAINCFNWDVYCMYASWEWEYSLEKREDFHDAYLKYIETAGIDQKTKSIFKQEENMVEEAACYLEEGSLWMMRNKKLEKYLNLRKQNIKLIEKLCKEEDKYIQIADEGIWAPLYDGFSYEKKEYNGIPYLIIMTGSDGYNYYGEECFNPNWICKAFVLDELLNLALGKLENGMAAVSTAA